MTCVLPAEGVVRDADFLRDPVGGLEADAADASGQRVGVGLDALDGGVAVSLVGMHRPARAHAVGVEEDHDVADDLLSGPGVLDALAALVADALHVLQAGGLVLDDVEDPLPELLDQLLGVNKTDALDHAAAQVFLDALLGGARGAVKHLAPELEAKLTVLDPAAFGGPITRR